MGATHIGVPCNSAHAFLRQALADGTWPLRPPIVDMIDRTADAVAAGGITVAGILATTGTIASGLYQRALEERGIRVVVPAAEQGEQELLVMEAIYGSDGIKAGHTTGRPRQLAEEAARRLVARGALGLVLGCTELPLVLSGLRMTFSGMEVPIVDSTAVLAAELCALEGMPGVVGGLGPEATIDLMQKMHTPTGLVALLRAIFHACVRRGARRDQDHLVMAVAAGPDLTRAVRQVRAAGATIIAAAAGTAALMNPPTPVLTGDVQDVAETVVRLAFCSVG